jgi:hypothetical protein
MRGEVLDTDKCMCVRPGGTGLPGACMLVPSFCELRGETFDATACRCVAPPGAKPPGDAEPYQQR